MLPPLADEGAVAIAGLDYILGLSADVNSVDTLGTEIGPREPLDFSAPLSAMQRVLLLG